MIEADKVLHLRKYILIVLRSSTKSCVPRSLYSTSPSACKEGYVLRSLYHSYPKVNSRPIHTAYNIRAFSTTVVESSVDEVDQKLTLFCNDVEHNQTWSVDRLKEVIQLCNESNYQLQPSTGVQLLRCCGNLPSTVEFNEKQNLIDQVWQLVKRNDDTLTLEHYNTLLDVHAKNCISVDPKEFLDNMSIQPDDDTYRLLFNTATKAGNTNHLESITKMILGKSISLNEDSFRTPIQTLLAKDNVTEALNIITLAQDAKLPVDKLYTELACKYATQGDIFNLIKILNDEPQSNVSLFKIIKSLSVSNNGRHIPDVANFLSDISDKSEMNNLLSELIRANRAPDAYTIIDYITMNERNMQHTTSFINDFLNQLIMLRAPTEVITRYAVSFVKSGREPMALANIADISLKLAREELSLAIFDAMQQNGIELRAHFYWPLLINAHQNEGEAKVYSLVALMQAKGVQLDIDTLYMYILPFVSTMNPITTWQRFQEIGVPKYILSTPLILFLLNRYRLDDVLRLCEYTYHILDYKILLRSLMYTYSVKRNPEKCAKVLANKQGLTYISLFLSKLLKNDHLGFTMMDIKSLLEVFNRYKVKFSIRDSNYLQNGINLKSSEMSNELCNIINSMTSRSIQYSMITTIPHPRYMTNNELACHLVELKSIERSTRQILMFLMKMCYLRDDLKTAEELKQEFDEHNYPWTFTIKMKLFYLYITHNKLKEAKELLLEINRTCGTFLFDTDKILMFATALVKAGEVKVACSVIESCADFHNQFFSSESSKFLTALAESKHCDQTEDMLYFLIEKKYGNIKTEMLEPLVLIPLNRNDLPSAVTTLTKCISDYKMLPLVVEVMTALLREKDNQRVQNIDKLIEEMYQTIADVSNAVEANTIVILGLANLNKMEELRTILQKQNISAVRLIHYFNNTQRDKDLNVLLRILEADQDSNIAQYPYYCNTLFASYSKAGDCNGVLALWELLRAKNFSPSQAFRQEITEFLLMNKIPLPDDLELEINKVNISDQ